MTLVSTLGTMLRLGIRARLDGDRLRLKGPPGTLADDVVLDAIKRHRAEIVALLQPPELGSTTDASAGDVVRQQLAEDLSSRDDADELMTRFDRRRLVSLPAQYPHPSARLTDEDAAVMSATEIRITFARCGSQS